MTTELDKRFLKILRKELTNKLIKDIKEQIEVTMNNLEFDFKRLEKPELLYESKVEMKEAEEKDG